MVVRIFMMTAMVLCSLALGYIFGGLEVDDLRTDQAVGRCLGQYDAITGKFKWTADQCPIEQEEL